jgi:hypothetical protein
MAPSSAAATAIRLAATITMMVAWNGRQRFRVPAAKFVPAEFVWLRVRIPAPLPVSSNAAALRLSRLALIPTATVVWNGQLRLPVQTLRSVRRDCAFHLAQMNAHCWILLNATVMAIRLAENMIVMVVWNGLVSLIVL